MSDATSRPIALLRFMYEESYPHRSKMTFRKLNDTMWQTFVLAVRADMKFLPGDVELIMKPFLHKGGCSGAHWFDAEGALARAVIEGNATAARAVLEYLGRKRFPFPDGRHLAGSSLYNQPKLDLIHVGARFSFRGQEVFVTSFNDDNGTVTFCSYRDFVRSKVDHRYTMTPTELRAERDKQRQVASTGVEE